MADWKMGGTAAVPDERLATATAAGGIKLTNDLGGTAALPTVVATHLAAPLPEAQGGTGQASLSAASVTATGSTAARTLAARFADVVNAKDFGAACDGVTDDGPALAAMLVTLGATNHTVVVPGNCVTNQALAFPANLEVRFLNNAVFLGTGAVTYAAPQIHLTDRPGSTAHLLEIDHYGDTGASAYGLDIQNYADDGEAPTPNTGARHAIVIHQYSDASGCAALQIDNTRSQPFIVLKNSKNETHSAGAHGVGDYFQIWGYSATAVYPANDPVFLGKLDHLLTWRPNDTSRPWTYRSDIACPALKVVGATAGHQALEVVQLGAAASINVSHQGAADGVVITPSSTADGYYPLKVNGRRNGGKFLISQDGTGYAALTCEKTGTGAGDALVIINKGTDYGIHATNGTSDTFTLNAAGMPRFGIGNTSAPPTAGTAYAGTLWYRSNGAGAKDDVLVCAKDATDTWAWRVIY